MFMHPGLTKNVSRHCDPAGGHHELLRSAELGCNLRFVGRAEDEIRIDAEEALGAIEGLEVRRVFSGWGFYRRGLLFAAAWEGEFRFRTHQGPDWIYEVVDRELLGRPDELVSVARRILARLEAEPAAARTGKRGSRAARAVGALWRGLGLYKPQPSALPGPGLVISRRRSGCLPQMGPCINMQLA